MSVNDTDLFKEDLFKIFLQLLKGFEEMFSTRQTQSGIKQLCCSN